jgi:hypothetical protein
MEKHIEQLHHRLLSSLDPTYPTGLAHGKMGLSIYFYHLSRLENDPKFQAIAEQILDQVIENGLSSNQSINVEEGLAGVGLGIIHLVKAGFVEGDVNELLEDIDQVIYRKLAFLENNTNYPSDELLHLIYYHYCRLIDQPNKHDRYPFEQLMIKLLNIFYANLTDDFLNESSTFSVYHYQLPLFLWITAKLLEQGFYDYRIYKMLDEMRLNVLSRFPVLHSNRLYLLWGMLALRPYLKDCSWQDYIQLLYKEIDLGKIFQQEMKDRTIFISNGVGMMFLLLEAINRDYPDYRMAYDPQFIYERIIQSDAWNAMIEKEYFYNIHRGLLNGFTGAYLILLKIRNGQLTIDN